jgi:glycosyltransferase involved in cell wall biosynthesis
VDERLISIVVPVYNEQDAIETLLGEIRATAQKAELRFQIVFVDDGSWDGSWRKIQALAAADPAVAGIRFRRNYGKAAALSAGFAAAQGDIVVMMDADLQDPPEELPRLLRKLDDGYDLVSGWKRHRLDPWHKVYPSRVFNKLIGWLTGVRLHDHVCGLKCMRRDVAKEIRVYGEMHRFLGVLSAARGFKVTEIPTLHRVRTTGAGKYGFTRFFKGFVDLITVWFLTRYRWRPQHLIGVTGIVLSLLVLLSSILALLVPAVWLISVFMPAITLMAVGLVAELIVAERSLSDLAVVAERTGWCAGEAVMGTKSAEV